MNPLYRNDRPGVMPASWYAATAEVPALRPALDGDTKVDVCIVGAGFTGLNAAIALAEKGLKVIVLEAHRAGFGASGRNGGQVSTGYNRSQRWLEKQMGRENARRVWDISEESKDLLRKQVAAFGPEAMYKPGVAHGEYSAGELRESHDEIAYLATHYGYDQIEPMGREQYSELVKSPLYVGGSLDRGAGHIHPLRYVLALARQAEAKGATIYEMTEVTDIQQGAPARIVTKTGTVTADHVVIAANGYLPPMLPAINARVMPINSFIAATEPLGERQRAVLAEDIAVADAKFVVNYYRFGEDGRFLFGGREAYTLGFPQDISTALIKRMCTLFPQLEGIKVDYVWGGTLGITMSRLPCIQRIAPNIISGAGFSGHGVAHTGIVGRIMAEAVAGQAGRFDVMASIPTPMFPGGSHLRMPLLTLAMTWYAIRDRLGI